MFEGVAKFSTFNPTEAHVLEKTVVNQTNNNAKDGNFSSQTFERRDLMELEWGKRLHHGLPTPLDLTLAMPGLGGEEREARYWAGGEVEGDQVRRMSVKRGAESREMEEEGRKKQRRSPSQEPLPSLPLFPGGRFTHPPPSLPSANSITSSYPSSTPLYSPPCPAPTYTLTPPLTPNTPQNTFTFSFPPPVSQSFPYTTSTTDNTAGLPEEQRLMRKILPKPMESPTTKSSFQPYSAALSYPVPYPPDSIMPRHSPQKFQFLQKQNSTLYYQAPPQQQGHQQLYQQLFQEHGGGGIYQQKQKQPRLNFPPVGAKMDRQTSTPPLVGDPQFFSIDKTPNLHVMIYKSYTIHTCVAQAPGKCHTAESQSSIQQSRIVLHR